MEKISVTLNDLGQWILYRGLVCEMIVKTGNAEKIDGDLWEFTEALDMSFEETRILPIDDWHSKIQEDLSEFVREWEMQHGMMKAE